MLHLQDNFTAGSGDRIEGFFTAIALQKPCKPIHSGRPDMDAVGASNAVHQSRWATQKLQASASSYHQRIPYLRRLPGRALAIVILIALINLLVWAGCGIVLSFHTRLVTTAVLSYTLGLRHALDADHISAIDLMTRRLVAAGQRPVTVGTYFSLGHSTIVIITSIVVAASSAAISHRFGSISEIGSIIGSSVSAGFLMLLGVMNGYIFYKLYQELQRKIVSPIGQESLDFSFEGPGCMMALLRKLLKLVDHPWKMYPVGILFGLGFDTSSEIALLGISSIEASQGTSFWLILIYPILFTAGMCLLDTFDGAAMMSLYTSARLAKDAIAVLYYQCVLTAITVIVAIVIGFIQLLNMIVNVRPGLGGTFWRGVRVAGDNYDIIGGGICGSFVLFGLVSVLLYKPWRLRVDRRRVQMATSDAQDELPYTDLVVSNEGPSGLLFENNVQVLESIPEERAPGSSAKMEALAVPYDKSRS